ncbi:MAG: 50S ribosomal protein L7/L12 [Candidatus Parcubacteria bacterium]|nr:MAG: 50S ribosomal protein L7/L12 [Candidatus Parcubacteria bacterium]
MSEKIQKIIDEISNLTVVELNSLIKSLEDKFGISAMPAAAVNVAAAPSAAPEAASSVVDLLLVDAGANKINVIKVIKELNPNISLKDAKDIADNPPQKVAEKLERAKAEEFKKKFEAAGAKVEIK